MNTDKTSNIDLNGLFNRHDVVLRNTSTPEYEGFWSAVGPIMAAYVGRGLDYSQAIENTFQLLDSFLGRLGQIHLAKQRVA